MVSVIIFMLTILNSIVCIDDIEDTKVKVVQLLNDIRKWMCERKLKLNDRKTEIMLVRGNMRDSLTEELETLI